MQVTQEELVQDFETFLSDVGMWNTFVKWLDDRGSTPEEYGFTPED